MISIKFLIYVLPVICLTTAIQPAFGQHADPMDTIEVSKAGKNAKADELYFAAVKNKMHGDNRAATELLEQYVAARPDVAAAYYDLSKLYYNGKNVDKAELYIKKAIGLNADNKWYKEEYASILAEKGSFAEAAKLMADLSVTEPQDPVYLITAAEYYERAKQYDQAISYLDKAIEQNGPDEEMLERKMQIYLSMNNVDKAAGVVEQMIAQDPQNGKYYKLLGEMYDNNRLPGKATEVYERARKIIPNDPSVQLGTAEHYLKSGDSVSYVSYVKKVIINNELDAETQLELLKSYIQSLPNDTMSRDQGMPLMRQLVIQHPSDPDVLAFYGAFLEACNQHDSAVIMYKRSLAIMPGNFNLWEKLLDNSIGKQDADSLVKYSERALRLFPNQAIAHYYNGIGHLNKGEYPAAIKSINRAIGLVPEHDKEKLAFMYGGLAEVYHENKQYDLSDQAFEKALKMSPDDATVLNNYSYYLSERGIKLDEAEVMSKRSLELRPNDGTFLDTYGWIQYQKGNYPTAKEYIQRAIDIAGTKADATLYNHLGNVYYKLNDKEKAVQNWKLSKQKNSDDPLIDKKISEGKLYE